MKSICYKCGEEMIEKSSYLKDKEKYKIIPKFNHKEHVIQNALYGKLKSKNILCEDCGNDFSQDIDKNFVSLFFPITERIKEVLIKKDNNRSGINRLKGVLYNDESLSKKIDVVYQESKVSPIIPYYKFDEDKNCVTIFANKKRAKQYKTLVLKELFDKGINTDKLNFLIKSDVSGEGILGVYFTEGREDFNKEFSLGFCKIALNFAMHSGIDRMELPRVLEIDNDGTGKLIYSKNLIPFVSIGTVDFTMELSRPELERHYPSHTLLLFSQKIGTDKKHLYCYIDLFSTFQYYVLLNDNYKGKDIYNSYHQATTKVEIPKVNINSIRPKYFNIIVDEFQIDRSKYKGKTMKEYMDFLQQEVNKFTFNPRLELESEIYYILSKLMENFILSKNENCKNELVRLFEKLNKEQVKGFMIEMNNYFVNDKKFNFKLFRRVFFENDGNNRVEALSSPLECVHPTISDEMRKEYCHLKFNQISRFIDKDKTTPNKR